MAAHQPSGLSKLVMRAWRRLMWAGMRGVTRRGDDLVTFHFRPKHSDGCGTWADPGLDIGRVAIVMQGPIAATFDFTVETMRLYRRHFGDCQLVLSTWEDTPAEQLAPLRAIGVEVLLSKKPSVPGLFNVNMQITSARRGVEHAVASGARWVVKTRTDQRMCEPNALHHLVALALSFPPAAGFTQKHRIVGVGHGTLKYAPYHLTDQTVFGHAEDMLRYWTPPLREQATPTHWPRQLREIYGLLPIGELCRLGAAETYLASSWLQRIGRTTTWTIEDSWAAYRDHFTVADYAATDFYWLKAQQQTYREHLTEYDRVSTRRELAFREWLLLHAGLLRPEHARPFEHVLDARFGDTVLPR